MIAVLMPSRSRPKKWLETYKKWRDPSTYNFQYVLSLDQDDPLLNVYLDISPEEFSLNNTGNYCKILVNKNRSAVDAINKAAAYCWADILMVVSDDTENLGYNWPDEIHRATSGKTDWILKTQDGIQDYIITMPIMDRAYYNRTGYIYHPDFTHLFCDTYLTCVADITGRKITSNLMFKHNHYSVNGTEPDELHKRNDATWKQGQETFIRLMNQFSLEERRRIKDQSMKNWLRNKGVQI